MGLGYLLVLGMALGAAGLGAFLVWTAWGLWKRSRWKLLAVFPLLLAGVCARGAFVLLMIFWREPPWGFHF